MSGFMSESLSGINGTRTSAKLILPKNITLLFLPPRSPELNPVENVRQFMRENWLSNVSATNGPQFS